MRDVCGSSLYLREAAVAGDLLRRHWPERPSWQDILARVAPPAVADDSEPGAWPHGWQLLASRALNSNLRKAELLTHMRPSDRACLRLQSGPHAGAWLAAVPTDPGTTLPPAHMHAGACASRCPSRAGIAEAMGSRGAAPRSMSWATMRSGLLARRAPLIEQAWVRVAREGLGPEGRVVPQQWSANTSAPGVSAQDRRRLDLVLYGATRLGEALC